MSKGKFTPITKPTGPEGAEMTRAGVLTGVVRTSKGFAVATAVFEADGSYTIKLGPSQSERVFVALEHKKMLSRLANAA